MNIELMMWKYDRHRHPCGHVGKLCDQHVVGLHCNNLLMWQVGQGTESGSGNGIRREERREKGQARIGMGLGGTRHPILV